MSVRASTYRHLYLNERFADAYLSICSGNDSIPESIPGSRQHQGKLTIRFRSRSVPGHDGSRTREINRYPVHQVVVCSNSEYFDAEVGMLQHLRSSSSCCCSSSSMVTRSAAGLELAHMQCSFVVASLPVCSDHQHQSMTSSDCHAKGGGCRL